MTGSLMLIGPADVRRLMESDDPGSTLVIYQGRAAVISADDLTADRYPGALSITSQQEVLGILGRPVTSEQDIEQLAANLDATASNLGG
jgi:hypothetical protein